jgi:signal peptidase I
MSEGMIPDPNSRAHTIDPIGEAHAYAALVAEEHERLRPSAPPAETIVAEAAITEAAVADDSAMAEALLAPAALSETAFARTTMAESVLGSTTLVETTAVTDIAIIDPAVLDQATSEPPAATGGAWNRMWREVLSGVQTLVSAAVYATLIVTFGVQVARVDGLSMAPTLEDHDRLIVNKLVYELGEPLPGDIVMLYYPLNPEKMFVKRVIAKEGDTVRIVDGRVYVNDVPLHDDYVPAEFRSHDDWGPQVIQQGYYFVMGDHRNNSSDSRHWGPVPKRYIVGKVKVRWWPIQDARIF